MVDRLSHDVAAKVGVVASSPLIRLLNTFMRLGGGGLQSRHSGPTSARAADSETRIARLILWEVANPLITGIASGY